MPRTLRPSLRLRQVRWHALGQQGRAGSNPGQRRKITIPSQPDEVDAVFQITHGRQDPGSNLEGGGKSVLPRGAADGGGDMRASAADVTPVAAAVASAMACADPAGVRGCHPRRERRGAPSTTWPATLPRAAPSTTCKKEISRLSTISAAGGTLKRRYTQEGTERERPPPHCPPPSPELPRAPPKQKRAGKNSKTDLKMPA